MKVIIEEPKKQPLCFETLEVGEVFSMLGRLHVKTSKASAAVLHSEPGNPLCIPPAGIHVQRVVSLTAKLGA